MPEYLTELLANHPFTGFDIVVAIILLLSVLVAVLRGLVREVVSLASWVGAIVVAWYAFEHVRVPARDVVGNDLLGDLLAGAGVFLLPFIIFKILGSMLADGVEGNRLGVIDRLGGLVYGLARGALLVCAGWLVAGFLLKPEQYPVWVRQAWVLPHVEEGATWLRGFLPEQLEAQGRAASAEALEKARQLDAVRGALGTPREGQLAAPEPAPEYSPEQRQQMDQLFKPDG
jgi:membrane protein required for colicin V production